MPGTIKAYLLACLMPKHASEFQRIKITSNYFRKLPQIDLIARTNLEMTWFSRPIREDFQCSVKLKFIYSEKATKLCKISTLLLSYVVPVKSKVEISQKFVAFSEYMNFT